MTAWAALAIYYSDLSSPSLRHALALAFPGGTVLGFAALPRRGRTLLGFLIAFAVLLAWWLRIAPSNQRDWQPDVAVLPYATVDGEHVTLHNIRNFEYRTETNFAPHWYDATFDVADIRSVDLIACYWMGMRSPTSSSASALRTIATSRSRSRRARSAASGIRPSRASSSSTSWSTS